MGYPRKLYDKEGRYVKTKICDDHMGHTHNDKFELTNGCMTKFKLHFDRDKKINPPPPPMRLNGFVLPDRKDGVLEGMSTPLGPVPCASAVEIGSEESP